jgi:HAD superfamily hydrolase (TIGR01458 family)
MCRTPVGVRGSDSTPPEVRPRARLRRMGPASLADVDGLLLDIDGVLATSWRPIEGSIEAMRWIRARGIPFRLITNTTTHTRDDLAATLRDAGFDVDVEGEDIITAVVATATYLLAHHPDARVALLSDGDARADLPGVDVVTVDDPADVVVIGGASDDFSYAAVNRAFELVRDGAALVGMHRNLYWRTTTGWQLDGGAYLAALEAATGTTATICGKPAPAFFSAALTLIGVPAERAVMVGDDIVNDVLGAQAAGIRGIQVRTGKFQVTDL